MSIIILGKVVRGKGKGKTLGFPTANIMLSEKVESGVYAGAVTTGGKKYKAGIFVDSSGKLLEAHLIGFSEDLYGKEIEVEVGEKIRSIVDFDSEEKLKKQIARDIEYICSQG